MKKTNSQSGFSLIELMIVVAIIGILAAIAIPNYQKFIRKSRQSEANSTLEGLFTAEQSYQGEYGGTSSALDVIGYLPQGRIHYNCGFLAVGASPATGPIAGRVPNDQGTKPGAVPDTATGCVAATCANGTTDFGGAAGAMTGAVTSATAFTITCNGFIGGAAQDIWQIDQAKKLSMTSDGT